MMVPSRPFVFRHVYDFVVFDHLSRIQFFSFIILCFFSGISSSLRIKSIHVPPTLRLGQATWLNCSYELEDDHLYSIKWFKSDLEEPDANKTEFYRYLANEQPPINVYETPGIFVQTNLSTKGDVYLFNSSLDTEGRFWCEVLADQPSFQTVFKDAIMHVHHLPPQGPTIQPSILSLDKSDIINTTCYTGPSKPQATLTWYVNDRKVSTRFVRNEDHLLKQTQSGLKASQVRLLLPSSEEPPVDGAYRLRCESKLVQKTTRASQVIIFSDSSKPSNKFLAVHEGEDPTISGTKNSYSLDDSISLNCTSTQASSAPELVWLVNEKPATAGQWHDPQVQSLTIGQIARSRLELFLSADKFISSTSLRKSLSLKRSRTPLDEDQKQLRIKCTSTLSKTISAQNAMIVVASNRQSSQLFVADRGGLRTVTNGQFNAGASTVSFLSSHILIPFFIICAALTILTALRATFSDA
ncbi:uncharacterized protein LOC141850587 [Brevipalpus obovatus]|uniref:uncharacterized protein LOC141850587 n=1 Tax=Brevipalpus obovatus TaxID=246614 RepID=UPI003D9F07A2